MFVRAYLSEHIYQSMVVRACLSEHVCPSMFVRACVQASSGRCSSALIYPTPPSQVDAHVATDAPSVPVRAQLHRNFPKGRHSRFHPPVQLPVPLPRPMQHAIEMQTAQFQITTNPFLVFLLNIKAPQNLAISA